MLKLNDSKSVGSVIYVVEGDRDEVNILKHIYYDILKYDVITYNKNEDIIYEFKNSINIYSRIYVVPAKYSAISRLEEYDYFDELYRRLSNKYNLNVENSHIYYLYDRDRKSNRPGKITKMMEKYNNSLDNGQNMNGMLLLSYPSIEAFYYNCFNKNAELSNGIDAKNHLIDLNIQDINKKELINGTDVVINKIEQMINDRFKTEYLDYFKEIGLKIFKYEEDYFLNNKYYDILSLIFISLIDLGIIIIDE